MVVNHNSGYLRKYRPVCQAKGELEQALVPIPPLKQTNIWQLTKYLVVLGCLLKILIKNVDNIYYVYIDSTFI